MDTVNFTELELQMIAEAVDYLLGAELTEEDGWTDDDIDALYSIADKLKSYT